MIWFADIQFGATHRQIPSPQWRPDARESGGSYEELGSSANETPVALDLDSVESIKAAAIYIREQFGSLDILVYDGGINRSSDPNATLRETYRAVFETNVFGMVVVVDAFLLLLCASKYLDRRIVNVTSSLGRIGIAYSPTSKYSVKVWELPAYRSSETAFNMINAVDAVRLQKENILSIVVCPGYCRKDFGAGRGAKSAEEGAQPIFRAATEGLQKNCLGRISAKITQTPHSAVL
ncbi:short-chain dehydrogenase [Aspergillus luchuensis IFO 4308]|nr:short-chain dehydrogenase [Aspergillus luchuensis IFO 4308]